MPVRMTGVDESGDVKETFSTEVKSVGTPMRMTERQGREDRDERTRRDQEQHDSVWFVTTPT